MKKHGAPVERVSRIESHLRVNETSAMGGAVGEGYVETNRSMLDNDPRIAALDTSELDFFLPGAEKVFTKEQMQQYERDGFLVIPRLFSVEELEEFRQRFLDISNGKVKTPNMLVMQDVALAKSGNRPPRSENTVTKLQDWQDDPVLSKYIRHPKLVEYVKPFCGESARSIHTMLINKPPDVGTGTSRHPMHQDLLYFPFRPANRIVAAWTAMEKITRANGCLSVIPGSHKLGLKPHGVPQWEGGANLAYQGISDIPQDLLDKRVYVEMEPGDTVLFHPCLYHGSGRNSTKGFRKAISCHYASGEFCTFTDIPDHNYGLLDEFAPQFKKRGVNVDEMSRGEYLWVYQQRWKMRSRSIFGIEPEHWQPRS